MKRMKISIIKSLQFILYMLCITTLTIAQKPDNEVGHYYDINFQMINGYIDEDYQPLKSLKVICMIGENFTPGYYYDLQNNIISGNLKCSNYSSDFKFKEGSSSKQKSIKPTDCLGYVVGVDSFAVIEIMHLQIYHGLEKYIKSKEFVEVLEEFEDYTFYKLTQGTFITYYVKSKDLDDYIAFPTGAKKFKEMAIQYFEEVEAAKSKIMEGKYKEKNVPELVKLLKYKRLHDCSGKIFFNKAWDEVNDAGRASYFGKVESIKDSIFHIKYYSNEEELLHEGHYTSFYPHVKNGKFIWYYPNGKVRKEADYINNMDQRVSTYYPNGNMHHEYKTLENRPFFINVYRLGGEQVLNDSGSGTEGFYDPIAERTITYEFKHYRLNNSYFAGSDNKKIYQLCATNCTLKAMNTFQTSINENLDYPISSIINNIYGTVLIKCVVEPSGMASDIQVVKGIDPECDSLIKNFLYVFKNYNHWKPAMVGKEKVAQEVIVPVNFVINGFSRQRNYFYLPGNPWIHHDMMNQQFIRSIRPPTF